jgi:hypothetical protein
MVTNGSSTRVVATPGTAIPNGTGNFTNFGDAVASPTSVLFRGEGDGQDGIYRSTNAGVLSAVADLNTIAPGTNGAHFASFSNVSPADNANSGDSYAEYDAFVATASDGRQGIYLARGSTIDLLIDTTQLLEGKTITSFSMSRDAIEDDNVAFEATFSDGSEGVFGAVATFPTPEPASAAVIILLVSQFGIRRR